MFTVALVALLLVAGAGGVAFRNSNRSNTFQNLAEFPVAEYRQGDPLWSNSSYCLSGTIDNIIMESKNRKNYLVVLKTNDTGALLPVIIPVTVPKSPLQRQQKLALKVTVEASGRILASECRID